MRHFYFLPIFFLFLLPFSSFSQQIICEDLAGIETYSVVPTDFNNTLLWSSTSPSVVFATTNSNITTINWNGVAPGTYTISFTETNSLGCDSTVNLTVTINESPNLSIATVQVCEGTTVAQVTAVVTNGTLPYTVNWGQPGSTLTETLDLSLVGAGYTGNDISAVLNLNQTVSVTDANGCSVSINENIVDVIPNPEPGAITF